MSAHKHKLEPKLSGEDSPKREAILDAALVLFAELGYHGTPVPAVAERAKVGAGTLYRYFANKEALVNALFQKWKLRLAQELMEDFPLDASAREKFHEIWKRLAGFAQKHPQALDFLELHHHQSYLDAESLAVEQALLGPLRVLIEAEQRKLEFKAAPPEVLGAIVFGGFMGLVQMNRKGLMQLTPKVLSVAEQCMWEAIRR